MRLQGISDKGFQRLAKVVRGQGTSEAEDLQDGISQVGLYYDSSVARQTLEDNFEDPENWVVMESDKAGMSLMDKTNIEAILGTMAPFENKFLPNGEVAFKVSDAGGALNGAGIQMQDIVAALSDYPSLDDEAYSAAQMDTALDSIESNGWGILDEEKAPENWANEVYTWLWENNQMAVESDDQGEVYVDESEIEPALKDLGWFFNDEEEL
jgi:hypothetical protein